MLIQITDRNKNNTVNEASVKRFNEEDVMVADMIAKLLAMKSQSMKYLSYRRPIQIYKPILKCKFLFF